MVGGDFSIGVICMQRFLIIRDIFSTTFCWSDMLNRAVKNVLALPYIHIPPIP